MFKFRVFSLLSFMREKLFQLIFSCHTVLLNYSVLESSFNFLLLDVLLNLMLLFNIPDTFSYCLVPSSMHSHMREARRNYSPLFLTTEQLHCLNKQLLSKVETLLIGFFCSDFPCCIPVHSCMSLSNDTWISIG